MGGRIAAGSSGAALAALDQRDMRAMDACLVGQLLLSELDCQASATDRSSKALLKFCQVHETAAGGERKKFTPADLLTCAHRI